MQDDLTQIMPFSNLLFILFIWFFGWQAYYIFNPVTVQTTFSDFSKEQYDKQYIISNPSSNIDYRVQIHHSTQYTS